MSDNTLMEVGRLVLLHGQEKVRETLPVRHRRLVEIAAEVVADEQQRIGISYTGFCLTALPHKRLEDTCPWEKRGYKVTLLVEPGRLRMGGHTKLYGVPYGARARMILFYLQTQAIRTSCREVALGRSMREWMERMGLSVGGETVRALREQALRISACSLKFFWEDDFSVGFERASIVHSGMQFHADDADTGKSWEDRVVLDEAFYAALQKNPVPLLETAIKQLCDRSMSLDIYVWMAWRCHQLTTKTAISWMALHNQFGGGFKLVRQFKPRFIEALSAAAAAYPNARIDIEETGIVLHPARPPVALQNIGRFVT